MLLSMKLFMFSYLKRDSVKKKGVYFIVFFLFLLSGCNDVEYVQSQQQNSQPQEEQKIPSSLVVFIGKFIDDAVQNLSYRCETKEKNVTQRDGSFSCFKDENVTFILGEKVFPPLKLQNNMMVTPYTLFPSSLTSVLNFTRLLIDLDTNASDQIITINKTREKLIPKDIDYSDDNFTQEIETALHTKLITKEEAHKRLNNSLTTLGIPIPSYGIIALPQPPTLLDTNLSVEENTEINTTIGKMQIQSIGDGNITAITGSGEDSEYFFIDTNGTVILQHLLDYETKSQYILDVVATNDIGNSQTKTLTINVVNQPETPPVLVDTTLSVLENVASGTKIGNVSIFSMGDTPISQIDITPSDTFFIDTNGSVFLKEGVTLDYETTKQYICDVVATNDFGKSNTIKLTILVNNFFDTVPTLGDTTLNVDENVSIGSVIGDINIVSQGDSNITNITLSNEDTFFVTKEGNVTLKTKLDYETQQSYLFEIIATNEYGKSAEKKLTINVQNVSEVPQLQDTNLTVQENKISGDEVGKITILDGGDSAISKITLSGDGSDNFVVSNDGMIRLSTTAFLDYETTPSYTLSAVARNLAGDSQAVKVLIVVKDYPFSPFEVAQIGKDEQENGAYLGYSVATYQNYMVIGAPYADIGGIIDGGVVYVFKKDQNETLTQIAKLTANDEANDDHFGRSVAINAQYIVVGATEEDEKAKDGGSAYLFAYDKNNTITQLQKIQPSTLSENEHFANSIALEGRYVLIGANNDDTIAQDSGKAYLFYIGFDNNITLVDTLAPNDLEANDWFGMSVAMSEKYIVIGTPNKDDKATNSGGAYLFSLENNQTTQIQKIIPFDGEEEDYFGWSVGLDNTHIVIGSYKNDAKDFDSGAVYVYNINTNKTISLLQKITPFDGKNGDYFGYSVAINNPYIVAGAYGENNQSGCAYTFKIQANNTITQLAKLEATIPQENNLFGYSLAFSQNNILIGAPKRAEGGFTYLFDTEPVSQIYLYNQDEIKQSIDEGQVATIYDIDAKSPEGNITYYLGGEDGGDFEIQGTKLKNRSAFDYETKNHYNFILSLEDTAQNQKSINIDLSINNLAYLSQNIIKNDDGVEGDKFGDAVAFDGGYVVVGDPYNDTVAQDGGIVFLYKKEADTLTFLTTISVDDLKQNEHFGQSVAIQNGYIVIGTSDESVYLFKVDSEDTVFYVTKIEANDKEAGDLFGESVVLQYPYILVGAPNKANQSGSVYLFEIQEDESVAQVAQITPSDAIEGDLFGESFAFEMPYIIIGAKGKNNNKGAGYLFKFDENATITELQEVAGAMEDDFFGYSVAINNGYILIGAPYNDTTSQNAGGVYLYKIQSDETLKQLDFIQPNNPLSNGYFGKMVAINNDIFISDAFSIDEEGVVYLYQKNSDTNITQIQKISSSQKGDYFGKSLFFDGNNLFIGAPKINQKGAVYIYEKD